MRVVQSRKLHGILTVIRVLCRDYGVLLHARLLNRNCSALSEFSVYQNINDLIDLHRLKTFCMMKTEKVFIFFMLHMDIFSI